MCLDRGLQQAKAALGPVALPSWPLHGRLQPALTDHHTIKSQYGGAQNDTKLNFTFPGELAGSAE